MSALVDLLASFLVIAVPIALAAGLVRLAEALGWTADPAACETPGERNDRARLIEDRVR
ncbi:MAG TPA: hypothetical protein VFJ85_03000 [Acidimicrobiales bacterium]|nr:hypothetical protein [Acidimicrobiales bacterium]